MGNKRHKATTRSVCTNSLPIADKISVDVRRNDGSLFLKEVPTRIVQAMAMSGHLFDVLHHPCVIFDLDKGPETRGGGKGIQGARCLFWHEARCLFWQGQPIGADIWHSRGDRWCYEWRECSLSPTLNGLSRNSSKPAIFGSVQRETNARAARRRSHNACAISPF